MQQINGLLLRYMSNISYLRVSTTQQTVANQRQAIASAGWSIDDEYTDEAVSGTTAADSRPGWAACATYLRKGDPLVVYALDRLGRSTIDVLQTINALSKREIRLVILMQGFDTHTPAGKLALTMFAAFAEFENGIRKERQQEGIARARTEGKYAGRTQTVSGAAGGVDSAVSSWGESKCVSPTFQY
ncbi:MAG: recombinase family protein [Glaciimonas sp.]|nr:recombinase family protein [Glaciimonas sp.]